ncbi:MAG: hypothetical protein IBJ11_11750 [Phycisphaerales bacterium]|nr:hypothetical protein [Phycisphaerales bacterium]
MVPLVSAAGKTLEWHHTRRLGKLLLELRGGDGRVYARLAWRKVTGSLAAGHTASETISLKREGFWHPRVTVRRPRGAADLAVFRMARSVRGVLVTLEGDAFEFRPVNRPLKGWSFVSGAGEPVVTFHAEHRWFRAARRFVTLHAAARGVPEVGWLVLLGRYLLALKEQDEAAAAASAAAAS